MGVPLAGRIWPIKPFGTYEENLSILPHVKGSHKLELFGFGKLGRRMRSLDHVIHSDEQQQDVFKVFSFLFRKYKSITTETAKLGLEFFAELAEEARDEPGKYPMIDLLDRVVELEAVLLCKIDGVYTFSD